MRAVPPWSPGFLTGFPLGIPGPAGIPGEWALSPLIGADIFLYFTARRARDGATPCGT